MDAAFPEGLEAGPVSRPKLGLIYVMKFEGKTYLLDVPDVSCEGQNQAVIRSQDGSWLLALHWIVSEST